MLTVKNMSGSKHQADKNNFDDVEFEDSLEEESLLVSEENYTELIKKYRQQLKELKRERQEYLAGWQRAKADYLNFKQDQNKLLKQQEALTNKRLLGELLTVYDSFKLAFADQVSWSQTPANWRQGVEYIYQQLLNFFRDHGASSFAQVGDDFSPEIHEAIALLPTTESAEDQKIVEVIKDGWRWHGELLRPAQVKVAEYQIETNN